MTATFKLTKFQPNFDGQTAVEWLPQQNAVSVRSRYFRLAAEVEVGIDNDEVYEIGFIQVLNTTRQVNYYTSGATQRWEVVGGELNASGYSVGDVNDSDADNNIPWYNINPARTVIRGPLAKQIISINMNDNLGNNISWTEAYAPTSYLFRAFRDDYFDVWLVTHGSLSPDYAVRAHVHWRLPWEIQFGWILNADGPAIPDHSSWVDNSQASIMRPNNPPPIPAQAFRTPRYNYAMGLYRYPADGSKKQGLAWADGRPGTPPV